MLATDVIMLLFLAPVVPPSYFQKEHSHAINHAGYGCDTVACFPPPVDPLPSAEAKVSNHFRISDTACCILPPPPPAFPTYLPFQAS